MKWFTETKKPQRKRAHIAYRAASIITTDRRNAGREDAEALFPLMRRMLETAMSRRGAFE